MLDEQLAITEKTSVLWKKTVETMRAMKEAGMVNEAAIVQSEANSYMIEASIPELKQQIREIENALSLILKEAPQQIERGSLKIAIVPRDDERRRSRTIVVEPSGRQGGRDGVRRHVLQHERRPVGFLPVAIDQRETSDGPTSWVAWSRTRAR